MIPLPNAQVAFSFLDSDCPDEFVRAFAVERLRELQDEELIDYLLQLVQVHMVYVTRFAKRVLYAHSFKSHFSLPFIGYNRQIVHVYTIAKV